MRFIAVIPARFGSTRLAAKPLRRIADKPLLQWVIEKSQKIRDLSELLVATDHPEIQQLAESLGVRAVMTDPQLPSGTDRVYQAVKGQEADVVFNIQGDEPLLRPEWVEALMEEFRTKPDFAMGTVATNLMEEELNHAHVVKVLVDEMSNGIYFSRFPIPYTRMKADELGVLPLKHIGLYAYRTDFLSRFCAVTPTNLEKAESLEQLRAMHMGERIRVLRVEGQTIGVDTEADIKTVEAILKGDS